MYSTNDTVWVYTYDLGILEAVFIRYGVRNLCHVDCGNGNVLLETVNVHNTEDLATDYATAINYKRGWFKRELQNNPSRRYDNQIQDSINSFPEMWI